MNQTMKAAIVPALNSRWELHEVQTPEPGPGQGRDRDVRQRPVLHGRASDPAASCRAPSLALSATSRSAKSSLSAPASPPARPVTELVSRGCSTLADAVNGAPERSRCSVNKPSVPASDLVADMPNTCWLMPMPPCCFPTVSITWRCAPLFCAGYTVWSGLRWAEPQPAERIAVVGIGGLGHLAVQFAKAAGFTTLAISHSPDKDKLARQLGADEVVRDGKSLAAAGGADVILGTSNSVDAMADSIAGLRPDGRLVLMGFENKVLPVHPADLIMNAFASSAANRTIANSSTKLCKSRPRARSRR